MDFGEIYTFLFETYAGIGVLIVISLVACTILAAVMEVRTRKRFVDRGPRSEDEEDEWSFFDDEEEKA